MYKIEILNNKWECVEVIHLLKNPSTSFLKRVRLQWSTKLQAVAIVKVYRLETNYAGELIKRSVS